jgi:hypothetical protein
MSYCCLIANIVLNYLNVSYVTWEVWLDCGTSRVLCWVSACLIQLFLLRRDHWIAVSALVEDTLVLSVYLSYQVWWYLLLSFIKQIFGGWWLRCSSCRWSALLLLMMMMMSLSGGVSVVLVFQIVIWTLLCNMLVAACIHIGEVLCGFGSLRMSGLLMILSWIGYVILRWTLWICSILAFLYFLCLTIWSLVYSIWIRVIHMCILVLFMSTSCFSIRRKLQRSSSIKHLIWMVLMLNQNTIDVISTTHDVLSIQDVGVRAQRSLRDKTMCTVNVTTLVTLVNKHVIYTLLIRILKY